MRRTSVVSSEPAETVAVDEVRDVSVRTTNRRVEHVRRDDLRPERLTDDRRRHDATAQVLAVVVRVRGTVQQSGDPAGHVTWRRTERRGRRHRRYTASEPGHINSLYGKSTSFFDELPLKYNPVLTLKFLSPIFNLLLSISIHINNSTNNRNSF